MPRMTDQMYDVHTNLADAALNKIARLLSNHELNHNNFIGQQPEIDPSLDPSYKVSLKKARKKSIEKHERELRKSVKEKSAVLIRELSELSDATREELEFAKPDVFIASETLDSKERAAYAKTLQHVSAPELKLHAETAAETGDLPLAAAVLSRLATMDSAAQPIKPEALLRKLPLPKAYTERRDLVTELHAKLGASLAQLTRFASGQDPKPTPYEKITQGLAQRQPDVPAGTEIYRGAPTPNGETKIERGLSERAALSGGE